MKKLLTLAVLAGVAAAGATMWPDVQRYIKIRSM